MGIIRKTMSVSTLGLVDFRSDKERIAKYGKRSMKEARKQTAMLGAALPAQMITARSTWQMSQAVVSNASSMPAAPPAGWYVDPANASVERWFDGTRWTEFSRDRGTLDPPAGTSAIE